MNNEILALFLLKVLPSFKFLFGNEYSEIMKSNYFGVKIKLQELFTISEHAIKTTPYYERTEQPFNVKSLEEFEHVFKPFGKEELLNNFDRLLSTHFQIKKYESMTTGGTSGAPSRFFVPKSRFRKEYGFFHKIWSSLGYNEDLRAVIRNNKLPENKIYQINPITKELIFDGFRNNNSYFDEIYKNILRFNINFIQGYPSSIYNFFKYLHRNEFDISFIKGVFLSSEIFLEHQRNFLSKKLGLPVISVYGHSEKLIMAVDFKGKGEYQIIEDYGYLELIDKDGKTIKEENVLGEIVGTTYTNFGMPLIRYRTGDYSSYKQYTKDKPRILMGIQGRWKEMKIFNKDGSFITPTALNLHDELYNYIDGIQYNQKKMGELQIKIVPNNDFNDLIENKLLAHFKERMLPDSKIELVKVNSLTKKKNGKFLLLETSVKQ